MSAIGLSGQRFRHEFRSATDELFVGTPALFIVGEKLGFEQGTLGEISLALAHSHHQRQYSATNQDDANSRRQLLAILGLDLELRIADRDAVIFFVRNRDHERQRAQHKQQNSYEGKSLHHPTPSTGYEMRFAKWRDNHTERALSWHRQKTL